MRNFIIEVIIYLLSFLLSLYALDSVDFSKLIRKNQSHKVILMYILISFSLAFLVGSMFLKLFYYL